MQIDNKTMLKKHQHRNVLLTYGYVRNIDTKKHVPNSVIDMCLQYFLKIGFYFTSPNPLLNGILIENIMNMNKWVQVIKFFPTMNSSICYSDNAIVQKNIENIYEWSFECNTRSNGPRDMIGITATPNTDNIWQSGSDSYCWMADFGICTQKGLYSADWNSKASSKWQTWKNGDEIMVRVNSQNWTLVFYKNKIKAFDVIQLENVDSKSVFYPFISCGTRTKYVHIV